MPDKRVSTGVAVITVTFMVLAGSVGATSADRAVADDLRIQIITTANVNGELEECGCKVNRKGGLARQVTLIDSLRARNPHTLVLDAGNWGDLNPSYGLLKADFVFRTMRGCGYDAVTPGHREFRWGLDHWEETADGRPDILAHNVVDDRGRPVGQEPLIRDMGGVRVGVFGLVDQTVIEQAGPEASRSWSASDVFESAEVIMDRLREADCQVIVLLAQMDVADVDELARRHPDLDVVVLGYRPGSETTPTTVAGTVVLRTGTRGRYVGCLDLTLTPEGEIVAHDGRSIMLDDRIRHDPEVQLLVNEVKIEIERIKHEDEETDQAGRHPVDTDPELTVATTK